MFGDLFTDLKKNKLEEQVSDMAYFFVHECGWTQQDFDNADVEFMQDIIKVHSKVMKKQKGRKR